MKASSTNIDVLQLQVKELQKQVKKIETDVKKDWRRDWYTEEDLNELFGKVSKRSLLRLRQSDKVRFGNHPACKHKYLYNREDIDNLFAGSIVTKTYIAVTANMFK